MNDEPRHFVEQLGRRGLPTRRLEEQFQVLDRLVQILQNFLAATYGGCGGANSMAGLLVHCLAIHINVWTEPLRLNLSGPGNGRVTYLSRFPEPIPKNSL